MNLLPPLCACAVCLMIGKGNQAYSDFPLESPACIDQYKQPSATIRELSGLLKDMRLKSFYNGARKHTLTFSLTTQDNIDTVLKEKIWHCYLVASAPLFTYKTYREIEPDVDMGDDRADIHHKSRVCLLMEKYIGLVRKTNKIKEPVKNQDHPAPVSSLLRAHPETVQKRAGAQSLPEGCPGKSRPSPFRQGKGIPEA